MNELRDRLRNKIEQMLDLCEVSETPMVCTLIRTQAGRMKVVELIEQYVVSDGTDIGVAIGRIEQEYNINLTD